MIPARLHARRRLSACLLTLALTLSSLVGYTLLVAYDVDLWRLPVSLWRYQRFPVDPTLADALPEPLPDDPRAIAAVTRSLVPWAMDADVYAVPWYVPTPREAVEARRGDCEAQAMVLASLLASKGVPYRLQASFSHIWVDYPGREESTGERSDEAMMQNINGRYTFRWPKLPELRHHYVVQRSLLWEPLSPTRKALLLLGWPLVAVAVPLRRRTRQTPLALLPQARRDGGNLEQRDRDAA